MSTYSTIVDRDKNKNKKEKNFFKLNFVYYEL